MPVINDLPERVIPGPRGVEYEVHRATIGIGDMQDFCIGFACYTDGIVVPSLMGKLIVNIGSSTFEFTDLLLGPAAEAVIKDLPGLSVIMICVDRRGMIRGATTVEHRNHMSRWCFF